MFDCDAVASIWKWGRNMKRKKRKVPSGVNFLNHPTDLIRLMSPESLAMDGRGGRIEKPPVRFGPRR